MLTAAAICTGRLLQFAGVSIFFGSSLFYLYGLPAGESETFSRRSWTRRILLWASLAGLVGVIVWVMAQTASVADQPSDAFDPGIVFGILTETRFGRTCLLRLALLTACVLLIAPHTRQRRLRLIVIALLGGAVAASFAWTGHGIKDDGFAGVVHLSADVVHLFTASFWLGALVPLTGLIIQSIRGETQPGAARSYLALQKFSGIATAVVALLLLSGILNSWFLIGADVLALFTSVYGQMLMVKIVLFALMLLLAAHNRYRLTPALAAGIERGGRRESDALYAFRRNLIIESGLGLLVLAIVAVLGTLEPPVSAAVGG